MSGTQEARPQRTKRPRDAQKQMLLILSRLALKHDLEIREQAATFHKMLAFGAGEQSGGHWTFRDQIEGQRPSGKPAMMMALTTDTALSAEDNQKVAAYTSSANSWETLLQRIYWSQFKKHFAATYAETVPVMEYISPAPAAPAAVVEYVCPAPTVR